jgi:mono/diheme cytochrome c family protein
MAIALGVLTVSALTVLGWRDTPSSTAAAGAWPVRAIGGRVFADRLKCARCHAETGPADPLDALRLSRGPEWMAGHLSDPEMIAPGLREPPAVVNEREIAAMIAYLRRLSRDPYPGFPVRTETAAAVFARYCVGCHTIDGDGGKDGPDLSVIGRKHDAAELKRWIFDPESVDPKAEMPSFGSRLTPGQLDSMAGYLAARR